jgi:ketosteroid isomerase-like protein
MNAKAGRMWIGGVAALTLALILLPSVAAAKETATDELWATIQKVTDAVMSDDQAVFSAKLADDVTAFDLDPEGKSVVIHSKAEAKAFFDASSAAAKKMNATMSIHYGEHRCTVSGDLGFCTATATFSMKSGDGQEMSQPSYGTFILRKTSAGWKAVHWHISPAVAPAQ